MPSAIVSFSDMEHNRDEPDAEIKRDDYRRQKLTDVEEEGDENGAGAVEKRPETPSPRKTRNYSDTSVVLTEDTDCFIIGMRVWVGGTKPGQIAYLGETQFAPGEWAGIVLDEPIGKNDGSVSGIRYFQCEAKRGVFSRLTRLTLAPLPDADVSPFRTPPTNGASRRPISPAGSTRSLVQRTSPSLNTSTTSLSSAHHDLKLGDRVIVQSSQGSKPGTLRYVGITDFAKGEWCGVELDDPIGKNDGSVEGKSYFKCQPKFGLFAPITKVSKSPSSRRPGHCVVHKSGTTTPALRRTGSKESMASMTSMTSAASSVRRVRLGVTSLSSAKKPASPKAASTLISKTPLQDVLREKENHIEQLMKEREIDRNEITRAATHAEQVEGKLLALRQEYEKYQIECETKFHEQLSLISQLTKERGELSSQLEDEKKKLEDAQFRFEEEAIFKDDYEVANKNQVARIKELEEHLRNEQQKNEKLEQDTKRLFETEESLAKTQVELESLQKAQEKTQKDIENKDTEMSSLKQKLAEAIEALTVEQKKTEKKAKDIENLLEEHNTVSSEKDLAISKSKEELNIANKLLKEKHIGNELALLKELKKVEMDLSAKTFDYEICSEKVKELESKVILLEEELKSAKSPESESEKEKRWNTNMEQLRNTLSNTNTELLKVKKELALKLLDKEMELREKDIKLNYENKELQKFKADMTQIITELSANSKSMKERYMQQIKARDTQLEELMNDLKNNSKDLISRKILTAKLQNELSSKNQFINKLKSEKEAFSDTHSEQNTYIKKLVEELRLAQINARQYERKYHNAEQLILQLKDIKQQHESQFKLMIDASKDSNAQLSIMNEELRKVEQSLENTRLEMSKKLDAASNLEQELRFTLATITDQNKIEKLHLEKQLKAAQETEAVLMERLELTSSEALKTQQELQQNILELSKSIERNEFESKKQLEINTDKIKELEQILEVTIVDWQNSSSELSRRIEELTAERDQLKLSLKEKMEQLIEAEEKAKGYLANQDMAHEQQIINLKSKIDQFKEKLEETSSKIQLQAQELVELKNSKTALEKRLSEEIEQVKSLTEIKAQAEKVTSETKIALMKTDEKVAELTEYVNKLNEEKTNFEKIVPELQEKVTDMTSKLKDMETENANIQNTVIEKDQKVAQVLEEINKLKAHRTSLDSALAEDENQISALTAQLEAACLEKVSSTDLLNTKEKIVSELNAEIEKLKKENATIVETIKQKDQHLLKITGDIESNLQKERTFAEAKLADKENKIVALTAQLEAINKEKGTNSELFAAQEKKLLDLNVDLQKLTQENSGIKNDISEKEKKLAEITEEITQLQSKKTLVETELAEKENKIVLLTTQVDTLIQEKEASQVICSRQERELSELLAKLKKLTEEKTSLDEAIAEKENQIAALKQELTEKEEQAKKTLEEKEKDHQEKLISLDKEKSELLKTIQEGEQNIAALNFDVQTLQTEKTKLELQVKEAKQLAAELNNELQKYGFDEVVSKEKIVDLHTEINEKEKIINRLETDLKYLKEKWENPDDNPVVLKLKAKLSEKEKQLNEKSSEINNLSIRLESFNNEKSTDSEIISAQETKISELKSEIEKLKQDKDTINDDIKKQLESLQKEKETILISMNDKEENIAKLLKEINGLETEKSALEIAVKENEQKYLQLKQQIEKTGDTNAVDNAKIMELETAVKDKENTITRLNSDLQKLKQEWEKPNNNPVVKDLNKKLKETDASLAKQKLEVSNLKIVYESLLNENLQLQQTWKLSIQQWKDKLSNLENIRQIASLQCDSLEEQVRILSEAQNAQNLGNGLQTEKIDHEHFKEQIDMDRMDVHKALEKVQLLLLEKEKELETKRTECAKMQKQLSQAQTRKREIPVPGSIAAKVTESSQKQAPKEKPCDMESYQKMLEEKELAIGQVQFLNSIIVDMQQKNDELQTKIQILENGFLGVSQEEDNVINRVVPLRMYCDICEVFDLHETEDCPVQMNEGSATRNEEDRVLPAARPYCEICEEFGHDTANCDADETY